MYILINNINKKSHNKNFIISTGSSLATGYLQTIIKRKKTSKKYEKYFLQFGKKYQTNKA